MFIGISLFDEVNGNTRWDFNADGRQLRTNAFPSELSNLDQSINQSFSQETNLVTIARMRIDDSILCWIGLYRFAPEPRSGVGTRGVGIWLENGTVSGETTLKFLHYLTDDWATRPIVEKTPQLDLSLFQDGYVLLGEFRRHADVRARDAVELSFRETACLVDLTTTGDEEEIATWLDRVQTDPIFDPFKRIYICNEKVVARKIRARVHVVHTDLLQNVDARDQYQSRMREREQRESRSLREVSEQTNQFPNTSALSGEFDRFKAVINQNYSRVRQELDIIRNDTISMRRGLIRFGIPLAGLCILLTLTQISLSLLVTPATSVDVKAPGRTAIADIKSPQASGQGQIDIPKDGGIQSAWAGLGDTKRAKIRELGKKLDDDTPPSQVEINELMRLLQELLSTNASAKKPS